MHTFRIRRGRLYCEGVPVDRIAREAGTPVYVYSYQIVVDHFDKLRAAFRSVKPLICFSVKANGNLAILKILVKRGAGLDIVSGGELYKALRAGCPPSRIVYASVGKSPKEIREALRVGIFCFNVESVAELEVIDREARKAGRIAPVALRINPDVQAHTHRYITTGTAENKFGIHIDVAEREILSRMDRFRSVALLGFHLHIGSQITQAGPFKQAIGRIRGVIERARARGLDIEWLNLGGGLGIIYKDEQPQTADQFARAVLPLLKPLTVKLIFEPGRFIVGNAGILVTEVLYEKQARGKRFVVVDAGMNDLIRPALYEAYHTVVPVEDHAKGGAVKNGAAGHAARSCDVVGPICESADVLARDRKLPQLKPGALLAVMGAGAYGFTMSSNYNGRPRAAEVMVRGSRSFVIRQRETREDLVRRDRVPAELLR